MAESTTTTAASMDASENSKAAAGAPDLFGRYVLTRRLGRGGMGVVHAAVWVGPEGVARPVCIKRVRAGADAPDSLVRMFVNEARLSMGLSHANIVQTIDFGRVADEYFLALELVDGTDLGTLLLTERADGRQIPPEVAAWVAAAICDGLAYAHARGVVHRDVKPGNVLLSRSGEVKIADFGVAALAAAGDRRARGTMAYMAPEQAREEVVDARVDVFSAGLVLYEMLAGHVAYGSADPATMRVRASEGRVPPLDESLPRALVEVVERMTERDPARRPSDAREVADALGTFIASAQASGAQPPARWLSARVSGLARVPEEQIRVQSTAADDRPATYFTRDGTQADFTKRILASTVPAIPSRRRPLARRAALGAGALVVVALAVAGLVGTFGDDATTSSSPRGGATARAGSPRSTRPEKARSEPRAEVAPRTAEVAPEPVSAAVATVSPPVQPRTGRPHRPVTGAATARPTPAPRAYLNVNAVPWALVEVDGVRKGETPLMGLSLAAGEHRVRLVHPPSGREWRTVVTLSPDERRPVFWRVPLAPEGE